MPKSLSIREVRTDKYGNVFTEFDKLSSDGDSLGNHTMSVRPGGDIDAQIAAVNAHMGGEGYAAIPEADVVKVKNTAKAAWTPENIAPVTAQVVEAIAVQQAAITEAAAKKAEAEATKAAATKAEAEAKVAADSCEAECARCKAAEAELAAMKQAAEEKKAFDAAVAAKVAEMVA